MSVDTEANTIQVVLAADANYVMPLTVAMCSAAVNCDRNRRLVFNVFQQGIDSRLRKKVEDSLNRTSFPDARVNWLSAPLERVVGLDTGHPRITSSGLVRLLIPDLVPGKLEKTLYLDCDVVVLDDLGKLWDTDFGQKSLLAAQDSIAWVGNPIGGLANYRELGIPADTKYFNSGVLLMNLRRWRERARTDQLLSHMRTHRAVMRNCDQEALNAVFFDDWGELDYRWNWQIIWRGFRVGTHCPTWTPPTARKSIVHFTSEEKPWLPGCDYDEKKFFFEYLERTEWEGWRVSRLKEFFGRSRRVLSDTRDAQGRLRRRALSGARDAFSGLYRMFKALK